ncbi:transglutaminase-like domain-containing protein [Anaeromyxobacter paludicola]|uniref:Transglutaminase n=1 Tax=Anaeromyxobacter paludicola TaxID=2918171 RepID=A0ABN6NDB8_9BACT|nr:transglutaminase-like domain-containing protein [Anaeromyxobacter paludicola]BDG10012.1 transglutaminase [Anaeromyxobacter paludicola]
MDRRDFLRLTGAVTAGLALPNPLSAARAEAPAGPAPRPSAPPRWRTFEVTTRVEVLKAAGATRVWLPTPLTRDTPFQRSLGNAWKAEGGTVAQWIDPVYGAGVVWAEFPAGAQPVVELTSRFATRDVAVDLSRPGSAPAESPATLARFTAATELLPTDGVVKSTAAEIVKGARGDLEKARAIYAWVVENGYRDPKTRGCGVGDVKFMLENHAMGGKCADLNALFVALARAEGIPARDVYGVRVAPSALGYASLGKAGGVITQAQHCRAEFYLPTHGWVPVDPADVRKVILEEGGGKTPDDPMVVAARQRLFGSWEMNWLALNYAHDLALPGATCGKVGFLMYPQAETGEARLDSLDPANFRYAISARELA